MDILAHLDAEKYDKYLICAQDAIESAEFAEKFTRAGVTIIRLESLKRAIGKHDIRAFRDLYRLIKKHDFDIVHSHSTKPGILARMAARLAGVSAVIHTVHGVAFHKNEPRLKRTFFYAIEFFATLFGHFLTSVNGYYKKHFRFVAKERFRIIYNGIDVSYRGKRMQQEKKQKHILYLSRLERAKDPLTLLKAANLLKNKYKRDDFKIKIAGDGDLMADCVQYVASHQLEQQVEFLGWVTEKTPVYQDADIFCVPSIFEAFGLVFAEAGLYELPTVATTVEGIPEVVINEKTGYLVSPQRPDLLAEKLVYLLDNPHECYRLGAAAKEYVLANFTKERMAEEYEKLYRQSLSRS